MQKNVKIYKNTRSLPKIFISEEDVVLLHQNRQTMDI